MGLLGTWQEWKDETGMFKNSSANMEEMAKNSQYEKGSLDTAGGVQPSKNNQIKQVGYGNVDQALQQRNLNKKTMIQNPANAGAMIAQSNINQQGTSKGEMPSNLGDKGYHKDEAEQLTWWQTLAKKAGIKDFDGAAANWKEKGGFEGLMSNPGFTLGLALMQSSAQGKTIGAGVLDNFVKAAGISAQFKDRMDARKEAPIEVTATDVGEVKSLLNTMNISSPSNIEKFFGFFGGKGNMEFKWDLASESIAVELKKEIKKLKENKKPGAPEVVYDTPMKLKILKRMFDQGRFKKEGGTWLTDATLQSTQEIPKFDSKAKGGPVQQGKPYVVGEQGPEIIIPRSDGDVLTNDDSQIYAMLLASNPQLQKVSRVRAQKIMRNRFPEYFEG
jgi:hypothetical protein